MNTFKLNIILTFFTVLLLHQWGCAQYFSNQRETIASELKFYLLDMDNGLSNNLINDIVEDSLGYIWIATTDGLNRYDGTSFKKYKSDPQSKNSNLTNNYIQQLELNKNGELLISTDGGLNIYNPKTEGFRVIDKKKGLRNNKVSCITNGPKQSLIIGTYGSGIQFADKNGRLISLKNPHEAENQLSSKKISALAMQGDSILWVGTFNNGLYKVNYTTGKVSPIHFPPDRRPGRESAAFTSPIINAVHTDTEGNVWVGSRKGLRVITIEGDMLQLNQSNNPENGLSDDDVLCFEEDGRGNIWIGTRNGGLNIIKKSSVLDQKNGKYHNIWYLPENNGTSVFNRTVSAITMDRESNMWLATPTGLNFVNPSGERIKLMQKELGTDQSLSHNRIGALANAENGGIWIGTDGGGLDLYDPIHKTFKHFRNNPENSASISNNYILSILEDSRSRLWVGTYQGGLNKQSADVRSFKHYLRESVEEGSDVRTLYEDSKKQIWVGTNRGGLYKYLEKKDAFEYIKELGKIDIRDIVEDKNENLWLATYGNGLVQFDPKTLNVIHYDTKNTSNFPSDVLFCLQLLPDGDILAGTRYGGLLRFSPQKHTFLTLTERDGLSNNTINSMTIDNSGCVWLGTFNGISRYDPNSKKLLNLKSLNNLQHGEFNIGAALTSTSGTLYLGGNNGLNVFGPKDISTPDKYPIVLHDLKVLNEPVLVTPDKKNGVLRKSIDFQGNIELRYDQNSLSLDFSALKYPDAKNIAYSYFLKGYTAYWVDTKGVGTVNISNIPPGDYTLKMKAQTSMGQATYKQFHITITPPFWKTIPAYILYILFGTALIWTIFKYYSERIHLKNSLLFEKKQRQMEHELNEERLRFFTAFSHELKTPLTLILAPLENLLSEIKSKKQQNNLKFIRRNAASLYSSITRLLEFRKSEEGLSQLNIEGYILSSYLTFWVTNYQPLAKEKSISLQCSVPEEKMLFWIDLDKMQVIINNLLSNAIKYCEEGGYVLVTLAYYDQHFEISVQDSGTGIRAGDLSHIFDWYYRSDSKVKKSGTGIGLALTKRFVELHNGSISVISEPGEETCFTISIPRRTTHTEPNVHKKTKIVHTEPSAQNLSENDLVKEIMSKTKEALIGTEEDRELILLIDDNPEVLLFLDGMLQDEYDLIHAKDGLDGVQKASKYVPNLIISDVMMPEKSGIELCAELKNNYSTSHIPIILLTAKSNKESINTGFKHGADEYIAKPFSTTLLKTRIRNLLDSRKQLQDYFQTKGQMVSESPSEKEPSPLKKEKAFLSKLEALIIEECQTENSNYAEVVAKKIGMSRTSLYRKIKALTGQSINAYMREVKIKRAAQLIEKENFTVSQASFEVGFNSVKYFRKIFKEHYGKLPSEFK